MKTILVTGATDGIGLETAKQLFQEGHHVLLHGRSDSKLAKAQEALTASGGSGKVSTYRADLSAFAEVKALAEQIKGDVSNLDVLINNAGVFKTPEPKLANGLDVRFVVNTVAPYVLTLALLPIVPKEGRIVNLSSAAQAPVDLSALRGEASLDDSQAYAQSKLAITMWSAHLAGELGADAPVVVAVNPASFLGSKMVKEAFGTPGKDISIGADILRQAALSDTFANASGQYFDNDFGEFRAPHTDALNSQKSAQLVREIESLLEAYAPSP